MAKYILIFSIFLTISIIFFIPAFAQESESLTITNLELSKSNTQGIVTINNTGTVDISDIRLSYNSFKDANGNEIILSIDPMFIPLIKSGEMKNIQVRAILPQTLSLGDYTTILNADTNGANANSEISFTNTYCSSGRVGNKLEIARVKDLSSQIEFEWKPLDKVEIEVKVRNSGEDEEVITTQLGLYDPYDQKFIDIGEDEKGMTIESESSGTIDFSIDIPSNIEEHDYKLYVKAYIDGEENIQCTDLIGGSLIEGSQDFKIINVNKQLREIVLKDIIIPSSIMAGFTENISLKVYNIGKYDENRIKVSITNEELGIHQESTPFSLRSGDSNTLYFNVTIPKEIQKAAYNFLFSVFYDYNKDTDNYDMSNKINQIVSVTKPDLNPPTLDLISPQDDYFTKEGFIDLLYKMDDESETVSCSLILNSEVKATNLLSLINQNAGSYGFSLYFEEGTYAWQIICTDEYGNENKSEIRDISIDGTAPEITLISPDREDEINSGFVDFEYKTNDISGVGYCNLIIDGLLKKSETNVQSDKIYTFSENLDEGEHWWALACADTFGNIGNSEIRTFNIEKKSPSVSFRRLGYNSNGCIESWQCTEWSACIERKQTRSCEDIEKCGTSLFKPEASKICEEKIVQTEDSNTVLLNSKNNNSNIELVPDNKYIFIIVSVFFIFGIVVLIGLIIIKG